MAWFKARTAKRQTFQKCRNTRVDRKPFATAPPAVPAKLCADGKESDMPYRDVKKRVTNWLSIQMAIGRLHHLDSRLLADMGIERNCIPDLVRGRCAR